MMAPAERPAESSALTTLNARSREIFRNIVDSYLFTGEPVGSRHLSRMLPMSLSPASVRNVMQDLEELGLIYAPHASAGRMPTQQGLRLFVDALLELGDLGREERARIDSQVRAAAEEGGFEGALAETTTLLSELTRGAGVVLTNKTDARLKHVEFVRLEAVRALAILVSEDGSIENRVVTTPPGMPASALVEASNFLNARIRGRTLAEVTAEIEAARREARQELDDIAARLVEAGLVSWSGAGGSRDQDRRDRAFASRRDRRGRQDLHRLGEQAVLALRIVDDRRAAQGQRASHRRRARRHRADQAQLRPHRADGRICGAGARRPQAPALGPESRFCCRRKRNVERVERRDFRA
jgi:heat-inducible transcriptional repressor